MSAVRARSSVSASTGATATVLAAATSSIAGTQIAQENFYNQATGGKLALNDTLNTQNGNNWDESQTNASSCGFAKGMYDSKTTSGFISPCLAKATNFGNLIAWTFPLAWLVARLQRVLSPLVKNALRGQAS